MYALLQAKTGMKIKEIYILNGSFMALINSYISKVEENVFIVRISLIKTKALIKIFLN